MAVTHVTYSLHVIPRVPTPPRLTAASGSGCPLCVRQHTAAPRSPFLLCSPEQHGAPRGERAGWPALPHRRTGRTGSSGDSASPPLALLLRQHSPSPGAGSSESLVLGEMHYIWCCLFPFGFYLVLLGFLLAPNAGRDCTVCTACCELAVQKAVGASGHSKGLQCSQREFWGVLLALLRALALLSLLSHQVDVWRKKCWGSEGPHVASCSTMDPALLPGRAVGSKW